MSNGQTNQNPRTPRGAFGLKKSQFNAQTGVPAGSTFDYVSGGTNYKITFEDLAASLEVTGTIVAGTEALTVPVLDKAGSVNTIRNLKAGTGIGLSLTPEDSIEIETAFTIDATGAPVFNDTTTPTTVRSITAASGSDITVGFDGTTIQIGRGAAPVTGKAIQINSMADFPDPVGGVITLSDDTSYQINNDLSTSNRFVLGDRTSIRGLGSAITTLTYTGTGTMFTSSDKSNSLNECGFVATTGTVLDWENTAGNEGNDSFTVDRCLIQCATFGTFTSGGTFFIFASTLVCSTDGILIAGTGIDVVQISVARGSIISAGTLIDYGTAIINSPSVINAEITVDVGATGISGLPASGNISAGGIGRLSAVTFLGTGTYVSGITQNDAQWIFAANTPIQNSRTDALIYMNGNATATVIAATNTPVLVAGTFTEELSSRMTATAAGRVTYDPTSPENLPIQARLLAYPVGGGTDTLAAYVAINGVVDANTESRFDASSSSSTSVSLTWQITFTQGDYVEVWIENQSDTSNIVVEDCVLRIN